MTLDRRRFLTLVTASSAFTVLSSGKGKSIAANPRSLGFTPVKLPIPLPIDGLDPETQKSAYRTYEVSDDLVLPDGFTYDIVASWGDRVGDSRFGYNNDYLSFIETKPGEGYLTVNFEYLSGRTWMRTFEKVIGKSLPFDAVRQKAGEGGRILAYSLPDGELKEKIAEISREGLIDQGIGVISLRRDANGKWRRTYSDRDRRVTGVSGLTDGRYLRSTGPATRIFTKKNKKGYEDGLGAKIIGTFQNCAGGTTPWGTVFSAEENFQDQVSEPVLADGSSLHPDTTPFAITSGRVDGRGNVFGLAGNKYGWMVEIDPANPNDYGTKHTWLGRFRHEAVAFLARAGEPIAVYSGCDRRGGHVYKFVSSEKVVNVKDKKNSRLFENGILYGAKFNPDGTGRWISLKPETAIDPVLPSSIASSRGDGMVALPNRERTVTDGELLIFKEDADVLAYKAKYKTLSDLYEGTPEEKQGAILIDAHYAATAAGVTCTGRPEDTEISADGTLYITFTSGTPSPKDGGADREIFQGPRGEVPYEFGWIMSLREDNTDPASLTFRWRIAAAGGEPAAGGRGFSNPDNLAFDDRENLWMVSDISNSGLNKAIPDRYREGVPLSQTELLGVFGNNAAWVLPKDDENAYPFAIGPVETELTGLYFTGDGETLFLAVQHPGEDGGIRENGAFEERKFVMTATNGEEFTQTRKVPIGSNWPGKGPNNPPRPAVVAIRRSNGKAIV
jgi:secreted PhoX family phosphatase